MFLKKMYPPVQQAVEEMRLEKATPFQKKLIGQIKSGKDVVAYAKEDAGKSTALAIALAQLLEKEKDDVPRSVYLVPNNEKLEAMEETFDKVCKHTSLRVKLVNTRKNILDQKDDIYFGADIVLAVPERLSELMSIEGLNAIEIKHVIIDDATPLMRHSTLTNIHRILESFPKAQLVFCGTTPTDGIERYSANFMQYPVHLDDGSIQK